MRLIKLYRKQIEHRKEYLKRIKSHDYLWLYCNVNTDGDIVREIINILKTLN